MKITAFVGSARLEYTYNAVKSFITNIQAWGHMEYEIIRLSDYNLKNCKGCKLCFEKGEEYCPLKDDRDILVDMIKSSDGVIFASPNYAFHISGIMKTFLDRIAYIFHRPEFFGKLFTSMVAQGIYGGGKILSYFNFIGPPMGFSTVKGSCITTLEPITEKMVLKNEKIVNKHSKRFYKKLINLKLTKPSVIQLIMFRISRTKIKTMLDNNYRDYTFYEEKGWFKSDYYYPVRISFMKRIIGKFVDKIVSH